MVNNRQKMAGALALGALLALAGSFYCAHRPNERSTSAAPTLSERVLGREQAYDGSSPVVQTGRSRESNNLADYLNALKQRCATATPHSGLEGYTIQESFPAQGTLEELTDLFHEDCAGRCFYQENSDGTITKIRINSREGIEWYDEILDGELGCYEFQGDNFWLYIDDSGNIKAWGIGKDSKIEAQDVYRQCR